MPRLIDADALPRHGNRGGLVWWSDIEEAPTVEIERHGTWTERYMEDDECRFTRHRWYCSECGKWQCYGKSDYCLNCGAKMDGERKETSDD